jgi:hypothetical protein
VLELWKKISRREIVFFAIAGAAPFCAVLAAGHAAHMRLLGRHLTPFLPFVLAFLGIGLKRLFWSPASWARVAALAAIFFLLLSALEIRFAPRHCRDDYRTAAAAARWAIASGKKVWWAADISTAAYYGVPLNSPDLTLSSDLSDRTIDTLPAPDLVCLSKPDIYDPDGKIRNYLREHQLKVTRVLPAFQIFERQPAPH